MFFIKNCIKLIIFMQITNMKKNLLLFFIISFLFTACASNNINNVDSSNENKTEIDTGKFNYEGWRNLIKDSFKIVSRTCNLLIDLWGNIITWIAGSDFVKQWLDNERNLVPYSDFVPYSIDQTYQYDNIISEKFSSNENNKINYKKIFLRSPNGISSYPLVNSIFVADTNNNKILKIDLTKGITSTFFDGTYNKHANKTFLFPKSISTDSLGNLYVIEAESNKIHRITPDGKNIEVFAGSRKQGSDNGMKSKASFNNPNGMIADMLANIYVADTKNNLIRKITNKGNVTTFAGTGMVGKNNGNKSQASFNCPEGIIIDSKNIIYISDTKNHLIRKIKNGIVTTIAGSGKKASIDGNGKLASFEFPGSMSIDKDDNIYVVETKTNKIRKITNKGKVTTIAGSGISGINDGTGNKSSFNSPTGITTTISGFTYVSDTNNNKIRQISEDGEVLTLELNEEIK